MNPFFKITWNTFDIFQSDLFSANQNLKWHHISTKLLNPQYPDDFGLYKASFAPTLTSNQGGNQIHVSVTQPTIDDLLTCLQNRHMMIL